MSGNKIIDCDQHEIIIQTDNGTIELTGTRHELMDLYNSIIECRGKGIATLAISTPTGYPMMFDPLKVSHMAISPLD